MNNQSSIPKIKINGYKVSQPNSDKLYIEKNWTGSLFPLLLLTVFMGLWYYGLLSGTDHNDPNIFKRIVNIVVDDPMILIFFLAPIIIIIPLLYKTARKIISKDQYFIDSKRGTIIKNNRLLTSFADITSLNLNRQNNEIIIVTENNSELKILKSRDTNGVRKIADLLSKFINLPLVNK